MSPLSGNEAPNGPGRVCPVAYRHDPQLLAAQPPLLAETLVLAGGLYGNPEALSAIEAHLAAEVASGRPPPLLVCNGDSHWLDADPHTFAHLAERLDHHVVLPGNVEHELLDSQLGVGCGCAYPPATPTVEVDASNAIMLRLQTMLDRHPALRASLQATVGTRTPWRRAQVADVSIGIVHGDPGSLAGWAFDAAQLPPPGALGEAGQRIVGWFRRADVAVFASSHTCSAALQDFDDGAGRCVVVNNGAAGLPVLRGDPRVLVTRIAASSLPGVVGAARLFGTRLGPLHIDLLALDWDRNGFLRRFRDVWPPGSPADASYGDRLRRGGSQSPLSALRLAR